jgi:NADP-dependent 3-hydroxy acid dehydrogenase YdfG
MAFSLAGKWVLITGASSGFGAAAAAAFAALRCQLLLGARRLDRLEIAASDARNAGAPQALWHELDVTKTASVQAFVQWARSKTSAVDVLVNNAGGAHGLEPVATGRDEDWEAMLQTNVLGLLRVTRAVLPMIPKDAGSSISMAPASASAPLIPAWRGPNSASSVSKATRNARRKCMPAFILSWRKTLPKPSCGWPRVRRMSTSTRWS